jgi:hypothetical protein
MVVSYHSSRSWSSQSAFVWNKKITNIPICIAINHGICTFFDNREINFKDAANSSTIMDIHTPQNIITRCGCTILDACLDCDDRESHDAGRDHTDTGRDGAARADRHRTQMALHKAEPLEDDALLSMRDAGNFTFPHEPLVASNKGVENEILVDDEVVDSLCEMPGAGRIGGGNNDGRT